MQIVTLHMVCFTNFVPDPEIQYSIGFSMIFFISAIILVNLGIIFAITGRAIKLIYMRYDKVVRIALGLDHIHLTFPSLDRIKSKILRERTALRNEKVDKRTVLERYKEH